MHLGSPKRPCQPPILAIVEAMSVYCYLKHFPLSGSPYSEGVTKAVHGLAQGLVQQGETVTIWGEGPESGTRMSEFGYRIEVFSAPNTHPSFKISPDLMQAIQTQLKPGDRVILNGIFHRSVYGLSKHLKQLGIPYVVAPHDPYHPAIFQKNKLIKTVYWHLKEARMLRSAAAVQVLDTRHAEWLARRGIPTPTIALPNGFDATDVMPESQLVWRQNIIPKLYFLGRMDAYNKGLDLLIEAIAQIVPKQPLQLTLQGPDWGDRAELQAQVKRLGLEDMVTFLEADYEHSSAELAMQHDIFCVPSRFEGFSLSALEAMLAGRVILISSIAGLAPHVEASACGVVVEPTIENIRDGIWDLLKYRDRWPISGERGRQYALDRLQWSAIAQQALQQWNALKSF